MLSVSLCSVAASCLKLSLYTTCHYQCQMQLYQLLLPQIKILWLQSLDADHLTMSVLLINICQFD